MSDTSPLLSLPYIQAAQAQKHVTHNEAVELLDAVTQISFEALEATIPPSNAAEGQAWAIGATPSGVWAGHDGEIATWRGGGWLFITPHVGWVAWDKTTATLTVWTATGWAVQGGPPDLDNLSGVGINTASDSTNKLAVAADATLLTHDGTGHQLKINKAGVSDTASLLYQTNWSGRAEMGLAGNDDFSIKVSADGTTFTEALRIDGATGAVAMPASGHRQLAPLTYRYYLQSDKRWIGPPNVTANQNAATGLGTAATPDIDNNSKGTFLPAGTVISTLTLAGDVSSLDVDDLDLRIYFQYGPWGNGWDNTTATTRVILHSVDDAGVLTGSGMNKMSFTLNYTTPSDGYFGIIMRPNAASTLTGTAYFYLAGGLDFSLPPSA